MQLLDPPVQYCHKSSMVTMTFVILLVILGILAFIQQGMIKTEH